jgi:sarcosine oxidase subunit gamma
MVERISPLAGLLTPRTEGVPGVRLGSRANLSLTQVAAWPDAASDVAAALGKALGVAPPPPGRVAEGPDGALARIGPLKWWLIDARSVVVDPAQGATLDLSHEQTPISVAGPDAAALLSRIVAVDLRERAFPPGAFAATGGAHMLLKLRRLSGDAPAYEAFVMRSLARDLWALLLDHARQFGVEVG